MVLLLHSRTHWNSGIDSTFYPLAVQYVAYLNNHIPSNFNGFPSDVFHGNIFSCHKLRMFHVWAVQCTSFIQKDQTVKSFPYGKKIPVAVYFLGIILLIPVTSLWSWTLPQDVFLLVITWCLMAHSAPLSIFQMMKISQYSVIVFPLTRSMIKYRWKLGIVLYFVMNGSLLLNGRRNTVSFNISTIFISLIIPPSLPFV